jgi:hypothetical protein
LVYLSPVCSSTFNINGNVGSIQVYSGLKSVTCKLWVNARKDNDLVLNKEKIETRSENAYAVAMYVRGFLDATSVVLDKKLWKSLDDSCKEDRALQLLTVLKKHGVAVKAKSASKAD